MLKSFKLKKWTSLLLAFVMTVSLMTQGLSTIAFAAVGDKVFDIVEITDFHGTLLDSSNNQVGAVLADRLKAIKAANPERTLLISGGDNYQGSALSNMLKGLPVQKVFNEMGIEVSALGNHEFDWGLDTIINYTQKDATYPIINANLYDNRTGKRVFEPYKVLTKDGVRIALIGAITNETPSIVLPAYTSNYTFTDVATEVNAVAKEIKDGNKADVIIAVIHEGDNRDNKTGPIFEIAGKLQNVNAVLGGHTHSVVAARASNGVPVYIANSNGKGYINAKMAVSADMKVSFPDPAVATDYVALDNASGYKTATPIVDAATKAIVDAANADISPITSEVIGQNTAAALTRTQIKNGTGSYGESYLGNWTADVTRNKVGADVGMANNGGLRIDIPTGNITVGTMWQFMPFDNTIVVVPMLKYDLKAILEQAVMDGGKGIQVSGIKFKYDPTRPNLNRVYEITREDGTAFGDYEVIKVATSDFVGTGGDLFTAFVKAGGKNPAYDTHILIRDALIENVKANKDKDPSIIAQTNGRILSGTAPAIAPADKITILATSDIHGNLLNFDYATLNTPSAQGGLSKVSAYAKKVRATTQNVMLIDNGDTIQGTPLNYYYNMVDQKSLYPMMAAMGNMGYDTWVYGNHEFNFGLPTLQRITNDAKKLGIHVLSANTYNKADGTNYVDAYYIKDFTVNGVTKKVAILGLTTKTIPSWEDPSHYEGLEFRDLVTEAQKWVKILREEQHVDVVIVSAHSGIKAATDTIPENQIDAIATQVSGIDAIVSGHIHKTINDTTSYKNPDGKIVPVLEPNKWGQFVSQIDITFDASGNVVLATKNVKMDVATVPVEDPAIVALAKPYQDTTLAYLQTKLGTSTGEFTGAGQLTQPTAIMELINKVQAEGAGAQLSIAAPLSSAARIPAGDVTIQGVSSVYVFENFLFGVKMTGAQVKAWMEWSARYYKQVSNPSDPIVKDPTLNIADYNLDQLYGASYDVDLTQPIGSRIKNLKYNGKLVKDTDVFTVAINNYRYNGGGGFMAAAGLSNTDPSIVTYDSAKALGDDGQVRSMMISYIKKYGTISPVHSNNWMLSTTSVVQEVAVDSITLDKSTLDLKVGESAAVTATIAPENATDKTVIWSTSDDKVATVENGVVTAVGAGSAVITAKSADGSIQAVVNLTVASVTVEVPGDTATPADPVKNLPKTGAVVDFSTLAGLGGVSTLLGAAFVMVESKRRNKKSA